MSIQKYPHEIFEEVCKLEDREDRIKHLKENAYKQVKTILQLCYNDKIILDLPKGKPPFDPVQEGREPATIANVLRHIGLLVKGSKISQLKKEKMWIGMLEQLPEEDALLLCAAKDGTITNLKNKKYRKITKSLVEAAFPEIL